MKKGLFWIAGLLLILGLAGCSSDVYQLSYTARGDSTNLLGITQTNQFQRTDDLNVVVKLNTHDDPVEVAVTFFKPDGSQEGETITTTVGEGVGSVILGLDWESRPSGEDWETGEWFVEVRVDGEKVDEQEFRVN